MKNYIQSYFNFTKKERRGVISLLVAILFVALLPVAYSYFQSKNEKFTPTFDEAFAQLNIQEKDSVANFFKKDYDNDSYPNKYKSDNENLNAPLFYFDPNTITEADWKKLGTKERTAASIQKYLSKGGKFRNADGILKIWGMSDELKDRLMPYVRIAVEEKYVSKYENDYKPYEKKVYEKKTIAAIDINLADSAAFESLPGIGGGYARRIINFRTKLGGFYKTDQIAETFGLPDSTYQKIKPYLLCNNTNITKININTATAEVLKAHPYIRWQLANVILNYKKQHGDFESLDELKKIVLIDGETFNKISPYLTL